MSTNNMKGPFTSSPWVPIPGIANFRDIGGYPIANGTGSVRKGLIYRCAEPSKITDAGKEKLRSLGVKKIYDLRSEPELKRLGDLTKIVEVEGVERFFVPVIRTEDYSPQALAKRYHAYMTGDHESAYRHILSSDPNAYRTIFQNLLTSPNPDPCVIHCTAGKDRTGVICALILMLAGARDEDIAKDYAYSTEGLASMRESILQYLMKDKASMNGAGREKAENMLSSRPESMMRFVEIVRSEYGGVEGYMMNTLGFTKEQVETIRCHLVTNELVDL
ncbi:protein-tyrosine phosphatase-like protein [Tirmania nivea]|nr:protein-tyrosine phosphatase-like protein [Tirmania nivea]